MAMSAKTADYTRRASTTLPEPVGRERASASEFPMTPSTCHGTPHARVPDGAEGLDPRQRPGQPSVLRSPTAAAIDAIDGLVTNDGAVSFAVEPVYSSERPDGEDIDGVMVNPNHVSPMPNVVENGRSMCESGSTMSLTDDYTSQANSQRIRASDFEVIRNIQRNRTNPLQGELVLGRKKDTMQLYAIKVFRKTSIGCDESSYAYARTEQAVLRLLAERCIPCTANLYWSFQDKKALYLIMDCLTHSMRTFVECHGVLAPEDAIIHASQLVHGLVAVHAAGVVHCSMNPDSVFLANGRVVVGNFGSAQIGNYGDHAFASKRSDRRQPGRTEPYQAPELLLEWIPDTAVDWWGFGLLLCFMLTAKHPLLDENDLAVSHPSVVASKILHGHISSWLTEDMDPLVSDLVQKCLERNPASRLSGEGVKAHAWFAEVCWEVTSPGTVLDHARDAARTGLCGRSQHLFEGQKVTGTVLGVDGTAVSPISPEELGDVDNFSFTWGNTTAGDFPTTTVLHNAAVDTHHDWDNWHGDDAESTGEDDYGVMIPSEFGVCHNLSSSPKKFGTVRKISSLNFHLDTLDTIPTSGRMNPLGASPSRRSQQPKPLSTFSSPFAATPDGPRNKLRKKTRPESSPASNSAYVQHPVLDLPPGIEQIGSGIGYTRRTDPVYSRLSFSTLTPRSCQGIFSRECFSGLTPLHGRKKAGSGSEERYERPEGGVSVMGDDDHSEDPMDTIMREMHGSRWNLGLFSHAGGADPRVYAALTRAAVGLGIGEAVGNMTRERLPVVPTELSTLSPASTLRLVSPSIRDLRYC